jgi:heme-degrading monooxygenase HmoA
METLFVLFRSGLPEEEVIRNFHERAARYREVKGLVQKYYLHDESSGEFGGMYIFDSKENLEAFSTSDLAKSIGTAQQFLEPPTRKVFHVSLVLHEEKK